MKRWQSCTKLNLHFRNPLTPPYKCNFCNTEMMIGHPNYAGNSYCECRKCKYKIGLKGKNLRSVIFKSWTTWHDNYELMIYKNFINKLNILENQERLIQTSPQIEIAKLLNYIELYQQIIGRQYK